MMQLVNALPNGAYKNNVDKSLSVNNTQLNVSELNWT